MSSCHNHLSSLCDLIFPCLQIFPESIRRSGRQNLQPGRSASSGEGELPASVTLEILLKLPIKSIIRCKCVCKSWYKLISDPYFARKYLTNPPFTVVVRSEHRTVLDPLDDESFCFLEIGRNGEVIRTPFTPLPLGFQRSGITGMVGSSNGFLCLVKSPQLGNQSRGNYVYNRDSIYNNQSVCIVNPLSGEFTMLPDVNRAEDIRDVVYGFGLSASRDEYKVVRIVIRSIFLAIGCGIEVASEIFTVGVDDKWRCFEDPCTPCYVFPCGIALNGILHWVGDDGCCGVIYAFDIGKECGCEIPLPSGLRDEKGDIDLAIWGDCLCLTNCHSDFQVDIWTMKQYGIVESWTRDLILKSWIPSDLRPHLLIPITTLANGDLLMSRLHGQSLMSFDPKTKRCSTLDVPEVEGTVSFSSVYNPNLFSTGNIFARGHQS